MLNICSLGTVLSFGILEWNENNAIAHREKTISPFKHMFALLSHTNFAMAWTIFILLHFVKCILQTELIIRTTI